MVVCNDWHSALVPMLIHAEKTMSGTVWDLCSCKLDVFVARMTHKK